jgi:hypothetical protein
MFKDIQILKSYCHNLLYLQLDARKSSWADSSLGLIRDSTNQSSGYPDLLLLLLFNRRIFGNMFLDLKRMNMLLTNLKLAKR